MSYIFQKILRLSFSGVFFILIFCLCNKEKVKKEYKPTNAHEAYIYSLEKANLKNTILYKKYTRAAKDALTQALIIHVPYSEYFLIEDDNPDAIGYRFSLEKGQKLKVKTDVITDDSLQIFIDIFRIKDTGNTEWYKVASANKDSLYLEFVARRKAEYILRIQPELLCEVQCKVEIEKESSLLFPVIGKNRNDIQSFFGDPRDGGRRIHHGVDIFAKRNTDVITSADGYITRTGSGRIGGKYVWTYYPSLGINCYYAHLETIAVKGGLKIKAGTKIGTVGNTGNAKYTPPHLHFGIYQSGIGPIDPYYFIATENETPEQITASMDYLGKSGRTNTENVKFKINDFVIELPLNSGLNIYAVNENTFRAELPDGRKGFINICEVDFNSKPIDYYTNNRITKLYYKPDCNAFVIKELQSGEELAILSFFKDFCLVRLKTGNQGWLKTRQLNPS
ncbi:MAG: M23 family metallopeptidase [Bacteroidales bacterium]|nr:M23 family metallopeptidase [Bacteroidales bacterium]